MARVVYQAPLLLILCNTFFVVWCFGILPYVPNPLPPCSDYEMLIINTRKCVLRCPIACVNGICFENGTCPCDGFYQTDVTTGALICAADCLTGCKEAGGFCAAPDLCICPAGQTFDAGVQRCVWLTTHLDSCLGRCKYGTCLNGVCTCAQGFVNSTSLLGQLCTATCTQDCGRHANCYLPNMCSCHKKHWHYDADGQCHTDIFF